MATSKVDIVNQAYRILGEAPISSLTEDNRRASLANDQFDQSLDHLLALQNWGFALKKQALVKELPAPVFGWINKFSFPTDFVRLYTPDSRVPARQPLAHFGKATFPYEIIGSTIETDEEEIFMTYVKRVEDMNELRPLFVTAFAGRLAYDLAYSVTGNDSKVDTAERYFTRALVKARSQDAREKGTQKPLGPAITSRFGSGSLLT